MLSFETFGGGRICVIDQNKFALNFDGEIIRYLNRQELEQIKRAASNALNTSQAEIDDHS